MHKIQDEVKQFYLEEPNQLETRIFLEMQLLEDYLKEHNLMSISKICFERWEKMWKNARSFWMFPDENDMKTMGNEEYQKL